MKQSMVPSSDAFQVAPIEFPRTVRTQTIRGATSFRSGRVVPVCFIPVLRGDAPVGRVQIPIRMEETEERLMNAVQVTARGVFVPFLASDRFDGREDFDRAYKKTPDGNNVTKDFFRTAAWPASSEIYRAAGLHAPVGATTNDWYVEAYNLLVNAQRKRRMKALPMRDTDDHTLAACLWGRSSVDHMVPEFDDARIDGEVPLNVVEANLPVKGFGILSSSTYNDTNKSVKETGGEVVTYDFMRKTDGYRFETDNTGIPQIFAEMQENGITVSLSNIELAKQTAHFAKLRAAMDIEEEHLLDLLCQGLSLPEQLEKEPITLSVKRSLIGYSTRFATDSANLDQSVTTGMSLIDLPIRMPRTDVGGCIVITVEAVPNQLYERREEPFLAATDPDELPNAMRDFLDPQKVDMVHNRRIDVRHTQPDGLFGYEPLNARWNIDRVALGGKFYREVPTAGFDENRQQVWAAEDVDPAFNEDFLLATDLHQEVFKVTTADYEPFECEVIGTVNVLGLTQQGKGLQEATDDYETIMQQVETARLEGDGTDT